MLQLRADLDVGGGAVAGRVEHVVSGRAARFESVGELLAFIARALDRSSGAGSGTRQPPGGGQGEPR